ncbi:TIGR02679 domain-containing protein [Paenibacillus polymyxa]|uniref:TIGR02679 domain-containing protein n=1 Tax=Paenibacillus polymyxa TaxID=1406 RepID=UPI000C9F3375|nr:TIGR02679 domain-containing protein [Paenibacillus polymyxa]PNQ85110.1 hypothetical protein C1T20_14085 [Paenibacillus polymyxa]
MELANRKTAKQYYADPSFENLLTTVFNKYQGLNGVKGNARIIVKTVAEAERLQDYFGNRTRRLIRPGSEVEVHLKIFAEELERGYKLTIPDLYDVLYGKQLLTRHEQKELKLTAWMDLFTKVRQDFKREFNISEEEIQTFNQKTFNWFSRLQAGDAKGYGVLRSTFNKGENAYSDLLDCLSALWHLIIKKQEMFAERGVSTEKITLPAFAAHMTQDSHAFDKKRSLGRLLGHALYDIDMRRVLANETLESDRTVVPEYLLERQVYRNFGVKDDDLSSISHVFVPNLIKGTSPRTLNLREIEEMEHLPRYSALYIVENPSAISHLADETIHFLNKNGLSLEQLPESFPALICTIGQARTASKLFIDKCLTSNPDCVIYYSGDLDWHGLQMMHRIEGQFTAQFHAWRMDVSIYRKYISTRSVALSNEDLKNLGQSSNVLEQEMVKVGAKKVYQELFGKELREDFIEVIHEAVRVEADY